MNPETTEQLQDRLLSYLDTLEQTVQTTTDFTAEQTPLLAQEYINYLTAYYTFCLALSVFSILASVGTAICILRFVKSLYGHPNPLPNPSDHWTQVPEMLFLTIPACTLLMSFTATYINTSSLLKLTIAPRVVLLEYIKSLL